MLRINSDNWPKVMETNTLPAHSSFPEPSGQVLASPIPQLKHICLLTNKSILSPLQLQWSKFPKDTRCNTLGHCLQKSNLVKNVQFSSNYWPGLHNPASPDTIPHISRQTEEPTRKKGVCNTLHNSKPRASLDYSALNRSWAIFHILLLLKTPKKR